MALTLEVAVYLALGALQVVLAVALLRLRFLDRANRALALLLILRGTFQITDSIDAWLDGAGPWLSVSLHAFLAYFVAIAYFVAVYPRPRRWLPPSPWGAAPFLTVMAALSLLFALRTFPGPDGFPLWFEPYFSVAELVFPIAALVLVRDALAMPAGPRRSSVLLVAIAFTLIDLYDTVSAGLESRFGATDSFGAAMRVLNLLLFTALAAMLLRAERRTADADVRRGLRRYLLAMAVAAGSGVTVVPLDAVFPDLGLGDWLAFFWDLALPVLLTYALLRHQLFDIDLKVKWTVRQSTIAASFIGVFFVVSEGAQQFLADDQGGLGFGPYLGIAATGLLVFALAPLQQAAERVANAALPNTRSPREMTRDERCGLYRQQVALAWADGSLSLDERQLLDGLRMHLGMMPEEAARLEGEVTKGLRKRAA